MLLTPAAFLACFFFLAVLIPAALVAPAERVAGAAFALLGPLACFLIGAIAVRSAGFLAALLLGLATLGFLTAILGLLQWAGLDSREALGLDGSGGRWPFERLPSTDAPGSVFAHVNVASEVAALGLLALIGLVRIRPRIPILVLAIPPVAVLAGFLLIGGSRAAWLATGGGVLVLFPWRILVRRWKTASVLALIGLVVLFAADRLVKVPGRGATPDVRPSERLLESFRLGQGTQRERIVLWTNTVQMIEQRPWTGHGPGLWADRYLEHARAAAIHEPDGLSRRRLPLRAHQEYLQAAADHGLPWTIGAVVLVLLAAFGLARLGMAGRAAVAVVLAIAILAAFAFPLRMAIPLHVLAILVGFGTACLGRPRTLPTHAGALLALLALAACLWVAIGWKGRIEASRDHLGVQRLERLLAVQPRAAEEMAVLATRAATRAPLSWPVVSRAGHEALRLGRGDRARAHLERALELRHAEPNAHLALARIAALAGRWDEALAHIHAARAVIPVDPDLRFAWAELLAARARDVVLERPRLAQTLRGEAEQQLEWIRQERAYHPEARILAATLAREVGDAVRAAQILEEAARNTAKEPSRRLLVARALAALPSDDPRYGRAGTRTLAIWQSLSGILGPIGERARLELRLAPWNRHRLVGAPRPAPAVMEEMLVLVEDWLRRDGSRQLEIVADRTRLLEALGRMEEARSAAAALAGRALRQGVFDPDARSLWLEAEERALRLAARR